MTQKLFFPRWFPTVTVILLLAMLILGGWMACCPWPGRKPQTDAVPSRAESLPTDPTVRSATSDGGTETSPRFREDPTAWRNGRSVPNVESLIWLLGPIGTAAAIVILIWHRHTHTGARSPARSQGTTNHTAFDEAGLLDSVDDGVITADLESRVQFLNDTAEKLTGWSLCDAQGQPLEQVLRVLDEETGRQLDLTPEEFLQAHRIRCPSVSPVLIDRSGLARPISGSGAPIPDRRGHPAGVLITFRDQTSQRAARHTLQQSQARFAELFRYSPLPMAVCRMTDGTLLDVNDAVCAFVGRSRVDLMGEPVSTLGLVGEAAGLPEILRRAADQGAVENQAVHCAVPGHPVRTGLLSARTLGGEGDRLCLVAIENTGERDCEIRKLTQRSQLDTALADLANAMLKADAELEPIASRVLHHAQRVTGSELGFVTSIDGETGDQIVLSCGEAAWLPTPAAQRADRIRLPIGSDGRHPGLWGHALNTREAYFTTDALRHPAVQGTQTGDVAVRSYLGVPVTVGVRLVGQIAVANGAEGYGEGHLASVRRLASLFGQFVRQLENREDLLESEARFRHITGCLSDLAYSYTLRFGGVPRLDRLSGAAVRLTGYTVDEIKALRCWGELIHESDRNLFDRQILALTPGASGSCEFRLRRRDGRLVWVASAAECVRDTRKPELLHIYGALVDITQKYEDEKKLRLNAAMMDSTRDGVMITDLTPSIVAVNRACMEITGYGEGEVLGRNPRILQSGRHGPAFYQALWTALRETGHWQGEIWNRRKSGEVYPEWVTISTVRNSEGEATHYVAVFTDISQLKQSESRLERLAHYDPLTGLPNRLLVKSRLEHAIDRARRRHGRIAVLFLDLDRFKTVNDSLGHPAGDALLAGVACRLLQRLRKEDTLGRLGGDEFLVIAEDLRASEDATVVAQALLEALDQSFTLPNGQEVYIRASIGISLYPEDGESSSELIRNADAAMYQVKDSGRNAHGYYTRALTHAATERLRMETRLRRALEREELVLHYQPIVAVADNRLLGAEALLRWQPPGEAVVPPARFLPMAEETGLIVPLGEWVLRHTCRQAKAWLLEGGAFGPMALNLSVRQFQQRDLERIVRSVLDETGLPPTCLELEITESCLMEQGERAEHSIRAIKALGVQLSIDDFGTGYSSLAYLKRLPLDRLKIDDSFIRDIPKDPNDTAIASTVIAMAHSLGLRAIAEGVETAAQLEFLRQQGCDAYQGFLYCPPLPADEFAARYLLNRD